MRPNSCGKKQMIFKTLKVTEGSFLDYRNLFYEKKICATMETIKLLMTFNSPAEIKVNFSLHNISSIERLNPFSLRNHFLGNVLYFNTGFSKLS